MVLISSFSDDIEVSLGQLNRFNKPVIDPKCLLKLHLSVLMSIYHFQATFILFITIFIWEVWFTCFPKWFGIIINTKFLKVLQLGLFIQICLQDSLSLKLENVTGIFLTNLPCFWDVIWSLFASEDSYQDRGFDSLIKFLFS